MARLLIDLFNHEIYLMIILGAISLILSYLGTGWIRRWALKRGVVDVPNQRSSHQQTTPRGGGMAVVVVFLVFMLLAGVFQGFQSRQFWGLLLNAAVIAALGFVDDLYTLRRTPRILAWIMITIVSIFCGIELRSISLPVLGLIQFGFFSPLVTFVWLIGVTNFFNFMDGIDGLAAGEALVGAGFLVLIAYSVGNTLVFTASALVFGAVLGFLPFNFPKAKIFMGDGGSNFLGYLFAALAVIGSQDQSARIPFVVVVILLGLFLFDASVTLIKRLPKGKDWLEPHRDHLYQRLIILRYTHFQVTGLYFLISMVFGITALFYIQSGGVAAAGLLLFPLLVFLILTTLTGRLENKRRGIENPAEK